MNKRYITKIIFLFILSLTISCKNDNKTIESKNDHDDLYKNIGEYINTNRERFLGNKLKGIEFYRLTDEQEIFYNKRLDFFMAILNNDEKPKIEYYKYAQEYYEKIPKIIKNYYFWSKDLLDESLFIILEEQFGDIKLPMKYMHEYYSEIDMFKKIDEETQE